MCKSPNPGPFPNHTVEIRRISKGPLSILRIVNTEKRQEEFL